MPLASFKDLCLDAGDALALAGFWGRVLGAEVVDHGGGVARLEPPSGSPAEVMWIGPVPEPRTGGTRVHLDLRLAEPDPAPLVAAGATLLRSPDGDVRWWVLTDPEGNEFCAFPPREGVRGPSGAALTTPFELVVAAADPLAQARWWASVVGGTASAGEEGGAYLEGADGFPWDYWVFDPVPWPKKVKNRMHWDLTMADATPDALVAAGATVQRAPDETIHWWVLTDPEGNEFCGFAPKS